MREVAVTEGDKVSAQFKFGYIAPIKAQTGLIFDLWNINWLYYCQILFVVTAALMVVISLITKAPDPKTVKYTFYGAHRRRRRQHARAGMRWMSS